MKLRKTLAIAVVFSIAASAVFAQGRTDRQRQQQSRQAQQRQQQQEQQERQRQQQAQLQADPQGWVLVGYDFDQDRQIDAYEYISFYDLQRARQASRQRARAGEGPQQAQARQRRPLQQAEQRQRQPLQQAGQRQRLMTTGEVRETRKVKLSGQDEQHLIARVYSDRGNLVPVDLGPVSKANRLNISEGDQISAVGIVGSINGKRMLMAQQARANDQTIRVERQRGRGAIRFRGTIQKTTTARVEGQDAPAHVLAMVKLQNGRVVPVDLGRQETLRDNDVSLSQGSQITFVAKPITVGNRRVLIAQRISTGDEPVNLTWLQDEQSLRQYRQNLEEFGRRMSRQAQQQRSRQQQSQQWNQQRNRQQQ